MDLQAFDISLDTSMLPPPALQIKRKTTEDEDDAIQELLASWDRDDASLSASEALQLMEGVEGAPPSPDSSHAINNSRARQRREIKQLREQRMALEATIRRLWSVADDALSRMDGYASVMRWKLAADEQRDRLKQAQYENAQLKRRIAELKQMVKGLKLTLRRRVAKNTFIRETLRLPLTSVVQPAKVTLSAEESAKVHSLVADLDRMRAKAASNTLFHSHEAATTSDSFLTWRVRSDSAHSCCSFEIAASEEIPYRKDAVDQALYAFRRQLRPDCLSFVAQVADAPPDLLVKTTQVPFTITEGSSVSRVRHASRTFVSDKNTMSVSIAFIDSAASLHHRGPGVMLKKQTYTSFSERVHVNPRTGREEHSTQIQLKTTFTPVGELRGHGPPLWDANFVERAIIPGCHRVLTSSLQRVENFLIDHHGVEY